MDKILFEKKNNIYIQFIYNTIHSLLIFNTIISTLYFRRNENRTIFDFFFCTESYSKINHRCTRNADKSGLSSNAQIKNT